MLKPWRLGRQGDGDLPLLPRLVSAAGGGATIQDGLLSGAELVLDVTLPTGATARRSTGWRARCPPRRRGGAWARDFGLPDPQLYRDPREPGALFVVGSDGRRLAFRTDGPTAGAHYTDEGATGTQSVTSFAEAREVAVAFLRRHDLLPASYRTVEERPFTQWETPVWTVNLVTELDGQPLLGGMALIGGRQRDGRCDVCERPPDGV
jgi:hypothetical protein